MGLTKFEKLIWDAIALLIERGELKVPERNGDLRRQPGNKRKVIHHLIEASESSRPISLLQIADELVLE